MRKRNKIRWLRRVALMEGVSFLVLVLIAMPLKYWWRMPEAVKFFGWIHGGLFVLLCLLLAWVMFTVKWPLGRGLLVFVAALLPFGPFLLDRRMRRYEQEQPAE